VAKKIEAGASDQPRPRGHASHPVELVTALVTVISLACVTLVSLHASSPAFAFCRHLIPWLIGFDALCCAYFWWEFFAGLRLASDRHAYVLTRGFWLVGALPLLLPLRWLRVGRVLRYLLVFRLSPQAREAWKLWARALLSHPVDLLLIATGLILLVGSGLIYLFERGAGGTIHSWWDALWLAVTSATTDSYGDVAPVTTAGRIVSILVAFFGIVIIGSITAVITGFIMREAQGEAAEETALHKELCQRLERIEGQLDELTRRKH
jgi:hypothetical protein